VIKEQQTGTSRHYLIEGPQVIRMTIQIPVSKNEQTGKDEVQNNQKIFFTAFNDKGTNGTALTAGGVQTIKVITLPNGVKLNTLSSTKDSAGNITGSIALTDQKLIPYLQTLIGTSTNVANQQTPISYVGSEGIVSGFAAPVSFIARDIYGNKTPTKP
jgi:hypothetical protein